jgi:hypothetical protein
LTKGDRIRYVDETSSGSNPCWKEWGYPGDSYIEYTEGLGMTNERRDSQMSGDTYYDRMLVFSQSGDETYGTPIAASCNDLMPNITLSEDSVLLSYMYGDSSSVTVFANYSYYVHSDQDCSSWVTFTDVGGPGNGVITFRTLNTNKDTIQRVCVFNVEIPPEVSVPIVVIQKPYPTAIGETGEDHFKLYPNPTTGILRISAREKISEVEVINSAGISIKGISCNSGEVTIDLSGNVPGLYLVRIKTGSGVVCRKVNLLK